MSGRIELKHCSLLVDIDIAGLISDLGKNPEICSESLKRATGIKSFLSKACKFFLEYSKGTIPNILGRWNSMQVFYFERYRGFQVTTATS